MATTRGKESAERKVIAERLSQLGQLAYPDYLKQLDAFSQVNQLTIRSQIDRLANVMPNIATVQSLATAFVTSREQVTNLLDGIVNLLPSYDSLHLLHSSNANALTLSVEQASRGLEAMIPEYALSLDTIDWKAVLVNPEILGGFVNSLPMPSLRDSFLSEALLSQFNLKNIAYRIQDAEGLIPDFRLAHESLITSYAELTSREWESWIEPFFDARLELFPSRALFLHANIAEQISVDTPSSTFVEVREEYVATASDQEDDELIVLLETVDPNLPSLFSGMQQVVVGREEDWFRHFCISSRELITHLLHLLAPDEEIFTWTSDDSYFHEQRPTRRARIEFITRNMESGNSKSYANSVFTAMLRAHQLLNEGTHTLTPQEIEVFAPSLIAQLRASIPLMIQLSRKEE